MASMDDLLATFSRDLHAGQTGDDLKDLHAKLAQTLSNPAPHQQYRPIPPPSGSTSSTASGPLPPPAPASSWNTPPPNSLLFSSSPNAFARAFQQNQSNHNYGNGSGNGSSSSSSSPAKRESGFVPMSQVIQEQDERAATATNDDRQNQHQQQDNGQNSSSSSNKPYHADVLPIRASPKDTGGFSNDAFKPLWEEKDRQQWNGFKQRGT
ncbi:hypothetical protein I317_04140 [Kwoniella heveanensis CBS 569]|uniref:Uncharacterized protein n=1 Tax=Kwoniella heveanensis BCC8398 TaxID=1296120 RepID=A0A1B9GR39_9TREE|nr:hypothetical protein I316_04877 [Kwoniella heveanensis BCC8398]OCF42054.1 hypothetical protein I317_04140 [Kwoniella heveanensis CBS 569]